MKNRIIALALALATCAPIGCASKTEHLVTTRIDVIHGTNRFSLVNPKDAKIGRAEIPTPYGPAVLTDYSTSANLGAIEAARLQAEAQMQWAERIGDKLESKFERLENRLATAYGFPDPQANQRAPAILVPATVVLTNAPAAK